MIENLFLLELFFFNFFELLKEKTETKLGHRKCNFCHLAGGTENFGRKTYGRKLIIRNLEIYISNQF
jgi:hypothetical protein